MYDVGTVNEESYDEDSANQWAEFGRDLDDMRGDPKATPADLNIASNLCIRAVKGIESLKNRIKPKSEGYTPSISQKLDDLEKKKEKLRKHLKKLESDVVAANNKFIEMREKQKGLYRKLLNVLHKVECVRKLTRLVDTRERNREEKLSEIERNLSGPFTDIQLLRSMKGVTSVGGRPNVDYTDIDPEALKKILELLEPQRQGLEHLSKVTKKDSYHADEMINKIKHVKLNL